MSTRKANAAYVRKDPNRWKNAGWTSVPNSILHNEDLPPLEAWAWSWLASHDGEFEVSGRVLWESNKHIGRNQAYDLLSNLEQRGYLLRHRVYDEATGVPYVQYDLQPTPVPESERTWTPPKAKRPRAPHPGSKAARANADQPVDNPVSPGQKGFPTGRESAGREGIPDRAGIRSDLHVPALSGSGGTSRQGGSRQGGSPYKEEKTIQKKEPTNQAEPSGSGPKSVTDNEVGWLEDAHTENGSDPDTPGFQLLASLGHPWTLGATSIRTIAPQVDALLAGGWTERELVDRWTTQPATNPPGALRFRIADTPQTPPHRRTGQATPRIGRFSPEQAAAAIDEYAATGPRGAAKAGSTIGERWEEPDRDPDMGSVEFLLNVLPDLTRAWVEARRPRLMAVLTGATTEGISA